MNRADNIRKEILLQLYATRLSLGAERIHRDGRKQGYDFSKSEIQSELQFLADQGLIVREDDPASTERKYRIHAKGVTHYEQNLAS